MILLSDISFYQHNEDAHQTWQNDPAWRRRLLPFNQDFVQPLATHPVKFDELALPVLLPLTATPDCEAHRFELVDGVRDVADMDGFPTSQLRRRTDEISTRSQIG